MKFSNFPGESKLPGWKSLEKIIIRREKVLKWVRKNISMPGQLSKLVPLGLNNTEKIPSGGTAGCRSLSIYPNKTLIFQRKLTCQYKWFLHDGTIYCKTEEIKQFYCKGDTRDAYVLALEITSKKCTLLLCFCSYFSIWLGSSVNTQRHKDILSKLHPLHFRGKKILPNMRI